MELLLNLVWLMLALPAYWIWRGEPGSARKSNAGKSGRSVLVLTCILMLLFPVISATDDLHFIRPEMEESTCYKRALKQAANDKAPSSLKIAAPPLAVRPEIASLGPTACACGLAFISAVASPPSISPESLAVRGPPAFLMA
ncbi:MAG TPA: hypothetical protein VFJ47_16815 [Terriglobales bacterium]|nr:hypothetical protein [Terriglobales bacterium]